MSKHQNYLSIQIILFINLLLKFQEIAEINLLIFVRKKKIYWAYIILFHYIIKKHSINLKKQNLKNVEKISKEIISLPIFPYLSENKQNKIIKEIKEFFK